MMRMYFSMTAALLLLLFNTGCEGDQTAEEQAMANDTGCFYCIDDVQEDTTTHNTQEDTHTNTEEDTQAPPEDTQVAVPDAGPDPAQYYFRWRGEFDRTAGTGQYSYEAVWLSSKAQSADCQVIYQLTAVTDEDPCSSCEFAVSFTVGDVIEERPLGQLCAGGPSPTGQQWVYGHDPVGGRLYGRDESGAWNVIGTSWVLNGGEMWETRVRIQ